LEEFLTYNQLHVINEDSASTTFQSGRVSSNIDLTIANNHLLDTIKDREILEEESCSDHNVIKYNPNFNPEKAHKYHSQGPRFIIKETDLTIMRKRTNALRRRYQRTLNNDKLRSSRKKTSISRRKRSTKQQ
jgi:hypothetical protein